MSALLLVFAEEHIVVAVDVTLSLHGEYLRVWHGVEGGRVVHIGEGSLRHVAGRDAGNAGNAGFEMWPWWPRQVAIRGRGQGRGATPKVFINVVGPRKEQASNFFGAIGIFEVAKIRNLIRSQKNDFLHFSGQLKANRGCRGRADWQKNVSPSLAGL